MSCLLAVIPVSLCEPLQESFTCEHFNCKKMLIDLKDVSNDISHFKMRGG